MEVIIKNIAIYSKCNRSFLKDVDELFYEKNNVENGEIITYIVISFKPLRKL